MSRYKFQLKPAGAIGKDLKLTLQLPGEPPPAEEVGGTPCENLFTAWAVEVQLGNTNSLPGYTQPQPMLVNVDEPTYTAPFPDGCFWFVIRFIGNLCTGDAIEWTLDDGGAGLTDISIQVDPDDRFIAYVTHNYHPGSTPSQLDGASFKAVPTFGGEAFGPPVYFAFDGNAYTYSWHSWSVVEWDLVNNYAPQFNVYTFAEYQGDLVNYWSLNGYIWRNADTLTAVVTQTAGDPKTLPTVEVGACTSWYMLRNVGESYAGAEFTVQMQVDGNDFGDPLIFTCEV